VNRNERRRAGKGTAGRPAAPFPATAAVDPRRLVAQGLQLHQMGRLGEAEALYRRAVTLDPREADALHFLGLAAHQKGDNAEARRLIEQAIAVDAKVAAFHSNLGEVHRALGAIDDAIACYRRALALDPNTADAQYCLGTALIEKELYDDAAAALALALRANPQDADAHLNLGIALARLGRTGEAETHFARALALKPDSAEIHFNLGLALKARGDYRAAYEHFVRTVELSPRMAEAHFQVGRVLSLLERPDDATRALRQALQLKPDLLDAELELGRVFGQQQRAVEAIQHYERVIARDSSSIEPMLGIGRVLIDQGRFEEARSWFTKALGQAPESAEATFCMGLAFQHEGRFEEAVCWHEKAIALQPDHGSAHYNLAMSRKFGSRDERVQALEQVLALDTLSGEQRSALDFALAKSYDDLGDYDAAFRYYKAGNDIRKREVGFEPVAFTRYVDRVIAAFSPALFAEKRRIGSESELPVFIVGMPRSGTSLVEQILASHPDVHGAGELDQVRRITQELPARIGTPEPFPDCVRRLEAPVAQAIASEHLAFLRSRAGSAARVTDKLPNNFQRLGLIALLFPKARIVHCVRDPLDTCLSCYFQYFEHGQPFAYDLEHLGLYYRDYERLMAHWRAVLPSPILDVPYEALIADQEGWSRKLVDFLGLPWDERCLAFHENERVVRTASFWQVRQPIYASSVGRWHHYGKHLGPLLKALGLRRPDAECDIRSD
jgi:tetratricopeptide (TPR) repeat protein